MAIRSRQTIVHGVAIRSFTGIEGRLRPGQRFETTVARLIYLASMGLAKEIGKTKAIAGPPNVKSAAPTPTPGKDDNGDEATKAKLKAKPKAKPKSKR